MKADEPPSFTPRGLPRDLAAFYVGASPEGFDGLVRAGTMPRPRSIDGRPVWDRLELDAAFDMLPREQPAAIKAAPVEAPRAFTPKTLAAFWGCSEGHIRRLIRSGDLPAFWLGQKLVRIRYDVALAYQAKQAVGNADSTAPRK